MVVLAGTLERERLCECHHNGPEDTTLQSITSKCGKSSEISQTLCRVLPRVPAATTMQNPPLVRELRHVSRYRHGSHRHDRPIDMQHVSHVRSQAIHQSRPDVCQHCRRTLFQDARTQTCLFFGLVVPKPYQAPKKKVTLF